VACGLRGQQLKEENLMSAGRNTGKQVALGSCVLAIGVMYAAFLLRTPLPVGWLPALLSIGIIMLGGLMLLGAVENIKPHDDNTH